MRIHLIDGTYELFRHYYALPSRRDKDGREVAAMLGVLNSVVAMMREGATHLAVATDHVVESFRNELYAGYKTGAGIDPELWHQFHPLEDALRSLGVVVWPMVELEADDALAAAARQASAAPGVQQVLICSPDKDLAQCVRGGKVVQLDRRRGLVRDADGVREKFGVLPGSIPDYLALVGDSADGFPGVPRWGAKSSSVVLARYGQLEAIPVDGAQWEVTLRGAAGLSAQLREHWPEALLFRDLATLRDETELFADVDELRWRGPTGEFTALCGRLRATGLADRVQQLADG